ncbi:MAG: cupin domain-containing protein [Gemmatimonadota bacterium]|nr:MAG: cupin domain-containing protein [Gemmatimonadota bacterium]
MSHCMNTTGGLAIALAVSVALASCTAEPEPETQAQGEPETAADAKLITLDLESGEYQRVLGGPPETHTMHSGLVTLAAGESVGEHSTEEYEELVVVLAGRGEMRVVDGPVMPLEVGRVAYCPPATTHNVFNTGSQPLQYLYLVARAVGD